MIYLLTNKTTQMEKVKNINKINLFSKDLLSLSLSTAIQAIADSMLVMFSVIFIYQKLDLSLLYIFILFSIDSILSIFGLIFGAKALGKIGIKNSIIIGSIFFMLNYGTFLIFDFNTTIAIVLYLITMVAARSFYWIGYHVDISLFTDQNKRGSQIGRIRNILSIVGVALPFIASLIIDKIGFNILFILAVLIYIISIFPLLKMNDTKQQYSFGFIETFKNIFSKRYIRNFFIGFSEGAEMGIKITIWPIIIFILMKNDINSIGILVSLVLLASLIVNSLVGKLTDIKSKSKIAKLGGILYGLGWIWKILSLTNLQLFVASTYQNIVEPILRIPRDSRFYEGARNKGDLIDEYVVMRIMSNFLGRSFILVLSTIFIIFIPYDFKYILILAAIASSLIGFLIKDIVKK